MNATEVISILQARKVLTAREADEIGQVHGIDAQNDVLLKHLIRKPDGAYEIFRDALRTTQQGHVANVLG